MIFRCLFHGSLAHRVQQAVLQIHNSINGSKRHRVQVKAKPLLCGDTHPERRGEDDHQKQEVKDGDEVKQHAILFIKGAENSVVQIRHIILYKQKKRFVLFGISPKSLRNYLRRCNSGS